MFKRLLIVVAISVLPLSFAFGTLAGSAHATPHRGGGRYLAVIRCHGMAEDTAAHVRLVEYHVGPSGIPYIVYRCKTHGY